MGELECMIVVTCDPGMLSSDYFRKGRKIFFVRWTLMTL